MPCDAMSGGLLNRWDLINGCTSISHLSSTRVKPQPFLLMPLCWRSAQHLSAMYGPAFTFGSLFTWTHGTSCGPRHVSLLCTLHAQVPGLRAAGVVRKEYIAPEQPTFPSASKRTILYSDHFGRCAYIRMQDPRTLVILPATER